MAAALATDWPAGALEVVLVDNGSKDNSVAVVKAAHPSVRLISSPRNAGFPANNLALTDLRDVDYVALLNPDTEAEPGWLAPLVDALERDARLGAASPLMVFADGGGVNNAGCELLRNGYARDRAMGQRDLTALVPGEVFAWSGGAVLLRPAYLEDVGLFDERLFLYYEDIDLAWRGRLRGWRYLFVPTSIVRHRHAATVGVGSTTHQLYSERNRLVVLVKNAPRRMAAEAVLRFPLSTLSYLVRDVVRPLTRGRRPTLGTVRLRLQSYIGFLRLLPHAVWQRRKCRGARIVTDEAITRWFVADN